MKNYYVELLPIAQSDIDAALSYIADDLCNPQAALNLHSGFSECFATLKQFPLSGTELQTNASLKRAYRWILVEHYIVLYTVDDEKETVTIMRVLYGTSDYLSVLKHDEQKTK